ncbi:MAG: antibiotic biosynthesis monooxygenase [Anaerolineae bacterium]|nr:antibiotic biosynthesis monooxygenase [Anaerolineae bacterium]
MIEIIQDFVVKEHVGGQFELLFGQGGAWSSLFTRCPGFRGTTLLRDIEDPRRYLAVEFWEKEGQRE